MNKIVSLLFLLLSSFSAYCGERVVSETTINEWGYRTVSIEDTQFIKKLEKINKNDQAIYPRFFISKECLKTSSEAIEKLQIIEELQKSDITHRDFDYRMGFVHQKCLFILNTDSMKFKLDNQPKVFELLKSYVHNNKAP